MIKLYSNQSSALLGSVVSYLEENNIGCQLRNEFSSGAMGDLGFINVWPEIWVDETVYQNAKTLLDSMLNVQTDGPQWRCKHCHEDNPSNFESCWQCGKNKVNKR